MNEEQRLVQKRMRVLEHAKKTGNVRKTCRYFGIGRSSFTGGKESLNGRVNLAWLTSPGLQDTIPISSPGRLWKEFSFCARNIIWAHSYSLVYGSLSRYKGQ